jgi:hypothetical protein
MKPAEASSKFEISLRITVEEIATRPSIDDSKPEGGDGNLRTLETMVEKY